MALKEKDFEVLKSKIIDAPLDISNDELHQLKHLYKLDNLNFIEIIKSFFKSINADNLDNFYFILEKLNDEIVDIAPFLSKPINQIFKLILKNKMYKKYAKISYLLQHSGDVKTLDILKDLLIAPNIEKILSGVEIYQIKKSIYILAKKFDKKDDVTYRIESEIAEIDAKWIEDLEY